MRINVYVEEQTGEVEPVMSERADEEIYDGIRFPLVSGMNLPEGSPSAVTFWIPVEGYATMGAMFYDAYQLCVKLSEQRSRS